MNFSIMSQKYYLVNDYYGDTIFVYQAPSAFNIDFRRLPKEDRTKYTIRRINRDLFEHQILSGTQERKAPSIPDNFIFLAKVLSLSRMLSFFLTVFCVTTGVVSSGIVIPVLLFVHGINEMVLAFSFLSAGCILFGIGWSKLVEDITESVRDNMADRY